jgi:type VI protein secretion system component VasA
MDLLDYYRNNLSYLRGLSDEFAAEFPKIARRLLISEYDCQDPYIERLLEGTAFLAAKVEKKLDEGYYPFMEALLNSIAPDALYPVPAGAILEVSPNPGEGGRCSKPVRFLKRLSPESIRRAGFPPPATRRSFTVPSAPRNT